MFFVRLMFRLFKPALRVPALRAFWSALRMDNHGGVSAIALPPPYDFGVGRHGADTEL
jgi:hypothetical protein